MIEGCLECISENVKMGSVGKRRSVRGAVRGAGGMLRGALGEMIDVSVN